MTIHFDNAATTCPLPAVLDLHARMCRDFFANPASLHTQGALAEREIMAAAKKLAGLLGASQEEIVFTSGGTEANNLAVFGVCEANARRGRHIVTTYSEHPSVAEACKRLEQKGWAVTWLGTDAAGQIDRSALAEAVRPDTVLVSLMHVNNETGAVCDIAHAARAVKEKNRAAIVHSDGVQAFGKLPAALRDIDLYSMSAHKVHGLRGVGALYIKKGTRIVPQICGGGQQNGLRSGTENTAGVCTFALASECMFAAMDENYARVSCVKSELADIALEDVFINGGADGSPYILNMSFIGVKAEVLLHCLEQDGILVSTGSACGSKNAKNILGYYGLDTARVESAIRFSFSHENTIEEAQTVKEALQKHVRSLRKRGAKRGIQ